MGWWDWRKAEGHHWGLGKGVVEEGTTERWRSVGGMYDALMLAGRHCVRLRSGGRAGGRVRGKEREVISEGFV